MTKPCSAGWGGNQFAVVLPGAQSSDLSGTAETIRSAVRAQVFRSSIGALSVTVSLGGVLAPGQAGDVAQMFGHEEEALSRAKLSGRDCFVEYRRSARQASDRRRTLHLGDRVLAALKGETLRLALQPVHRRRRWRSGVPRGASAAGGARRRLPARRRLHERRRTARARTLGRPPCSHPRDRCWRPSPTFIW